MSNGKSDDGVIIEYVGHRTSFLEPQLVEGHPKSLYYIDPELIPKTRSMIDYDWVLLSFDSFYVFDEEKNIHGTKVKIAQRKKSL